MTGGKTGGHAFPLMGLWEDMRVRYPDCEATVIGIRGGWEERMAQRYGIPWMSLWSPSSSVRGLRFAMRLVGTIVGFFQSVWIIRHLRPDGVFSTGSFVGVPVLMAACFCRIPIVLHEQNVVLGRANRFFRNKAKAIFTSFDIKFLERNHPCVFTYGNPLRRESLETEDEHELCQKKRLPSDRTKTILIVGGSQGAVRVNSLVLNMLPFLSPDERDHWHFIHLTGTHDQQPVASVYKHYGIAADVVSFEPNMGSLYQRANLVIARAGATTIAELNAWGLPMILIPITQSVYDHQRKNAMFQQHQGAALWIPEDAAPEYLYKHMQDLLSNQRTYNGMAEKSYALGRRDAAERMSLKLYQLITETKGKERAARE